MLRGVATGKIESIVARAELVKGETLVDPRKERRRRRLIGGAIVSREQLPPKRLTHCWPTTNASDIQRTTANVTSA